MARISTDYIDDINSTPLDDIALRMGLKLKHLKKDEYLIPCASIDHDDNNPSMSINPVKQEYFCHSCNCSGGGAINFIAAANGIDPKTDFLNAIETASSFLGMDIRYDAESAHTVSQRDAINYVSGMLGKQGKPTEQKLAEFITTRGITRNDITTWGLQYAQKGFGYKFDKKFVPTLSEMGLATIKESTKAGGGTYQFFPLNERLIFPINDAKGKLIAFAGRNLTDESYGPKYKNTENSILFTKSNTIYGLDKVIEEHRLSGGEGKLTDIQVLEGYMDVIATHRVGLKTSVAAMGTSFPESQLELLSRHAKGITFMFDPDSAGIKASQSAMLKACRLADKMRFRFAFSPDHNGEKTDPDFLICNGLQQEYIDAINNAHSLSSVAANYVMAGSEINSVEDLIGEPTERAKEIYLSMPAGIVREGFSQELAKILSNKLGFQLDPSLMGMRLDVEAEHLNKGIETKTSIQVREPLNEPKQALNTPKSSPAPKKETIPVAEFISNELPKFDDWVMLTNATDTNLAIGKVQSVDGDSVFLNTPNTRTKAISVKISDVKKLLVEKSMPSKFANAKDNRSVGDTILLMGGAWYSSVPNPNLAQRNKHPTSKDHNTKKLKAFEEIKKEAARDNSPSVF